MGLLAYWKQGLGFIVVVATFFSGWHVRGLQEEANNAAEISMEVSRAELKIIDNQKIDTDYNKEVYNITSKADNQKIEGLSEKVNSCVIPVEWVRYINTDN